MGINKEDVESAVETISTCSYEHGKCLGIRLASDKLLNIAGEEFKKGNDKLSFSLREMSQALIKYAEDAEKKWEREYKEPSSFSWDIIEKLRIE